MILSPRASPDIWFSGLAGAFERRHGLLRFFLEEPPGGKEPSTSSA
jgi:hypothetical protein